MDFFAAQARAQQRTRRLVLVFVLAVAGTVAAGYFAAILVLRQAAPRLEQVEASYWNYQHTGRWFGPAGRSGWWDPTLLAAVTTGTLAVVGLAALFKWQQFRAGGRAVAESVGGQLVEPGTVEPAERRLLNVVEEMAIASGAPVPSVYLLPDEAGINAFAAGLTTSDAVIAVTRGALEKLSRDELQGVVAHEFSHILNGDMRMNLRIAATVFGILVLGLAGRGILWSLRGARGRSRRGGGVAAGLGLFGLALMLVGYVGYFFGRLIQAAVSRQREFLADASAVQFTRNPAGILGALKKIGGYALGSRLHASRSTTIGHFLFAQGFRTGFTGLWSTHPPLVERIRAIDPSFDGRMFEPAERVDVTQDSFVTAGLVQGPAPAPARPAHPTHIARIPFPVAPLAAASLVGTLTPGQIASARELIHAIPARLRAAAHNPDEAGIVLYCLLLDAELNLRLAQRNLVGRLAGAEVLKRLDELLVEFDAIGPEHRLPLLQLALPALRRLRPDALDTILGVLDELVHADRRVSVFEFALQKLVVHTLELNRRPDSAGDQLHSFNAVADEIGTVLASVAQAAAPSAALARAAVSRAIPHLRLIEGRLRFSAETGIDFARLDRALDRLALASPPIKERLLRAAADVIITDGRVHITEFELLRAIAAALDCPMPPLAIPA